MHVVHFRMQNGEHYSLLTDDAGVPMHLPLLYSLQRRNQGGSYRLRKAMLRLQDLYAAFSLLNMDLESAHAQVRSFHEISRLLCADWSRRIATVDLPERQTGCGTIGFGNGARSFSGRSTVRTGRTASATLSFGDRPRPIASRRSATDYWCFTSQPACRLAYLSSAPRTRAARSPAPAGRRSPAHDDGS